MTSEYFQRVLLEQLQGKFHIVVDRDVVGRIYPAGPRPSSADIRLALDDALTNNRPLPPVGKSSQEQFVEACQKDNLEVSVHEPGGHYVVAHKRLWHFCYYCGSDAHDDTPCPHRREDAERFAKEGQALYPRKLTVRYQVVSSDRTKMLHQNGKIAVPGVWEEEETQNVIQETIQKLHPGWVVSGWALVK